MLANGLADLGAEDILTSGADVFADSETRAIFKFDEALSHVDLRHLVAVLVLLPVGFGIQIISVPEDDRVLFQPPFVQYVGA